MSIIQEKEVQTSEIRCTNVHNLQIYVPFPSRSPKHVKLVFSSIFEMSVEANVFCFSSVLSLSRCSWKSAIFVVCSTADELSVELDAPEFLSDF